MDEIEEKLEHDKRIAKQNIELGNCLARLKTNSDFQLLVQHFESKLDKISLHWARSNDSESLLLMQALLNFKRELVDIETIANQAKVDLQLIHDYESNNLRD